MQLIENGDSQAETILILAHGAGAPMDSGFMEAMAKGIAECGSRVIRFEFDYMAQRRMTGKKRPPARADKLIDEFANLLRTILANHEGSKVFIGGKSMGGRIASLLTSQLEKGGDQSQMPAGWIALGYPFHPVGKPESLRTEHLPELSIPGLILQGERDPFGNRKENVENHLSKTTKLIWLPDGNHDLSPPKRSEFTQDDNWQGAAKEISSFMVDCGFKRCDK